MNDKTTRNSPCPCGSGKKFKKCCGADIPSGMENLFAPFPEDMLTGTKLDFYFEIYKIAAVYAEGLKTDPKHGAELRRLCKDFEERFNPGTEYGLPDSFYMNWIVLDNRFGVDQRTAIERMLAEKELDKFPGEVRESLQELSESYATCYEINRKTGKSISFEELVTGVKWTVNRLGGAYEDDSKPGEIWHARFIGPRDDAYCFGQPFVFGREAKRDFIKIVREQISTFKEYAGTRSFEFKIPRDVFKASIGFWAEYFYEGTLQEFKDKSHSAGS